MWTPPLPEHRILGRDEVEDLLGKGHDQAARQGEKALGTLGGVMALEGEAHLHHAPAWDRMVAKAAPSRVCLKDISSKPKPQQFRAY